jgi:exonuclease SbcC
MKQVLTENRERRLEILRRAFGIDEYSIGKKNTDIISSWIRTEIRATSEITRDLPEKRALLHERKKKEQDICDEIDSIRKSVSGLDKQLTELQEPVSELEGKKDLILQLQTSIPYLKDSLIKNHRRKEEVQQMMVKLDFDRIAINKSEEIVKTLKHKYDDYIDKKEKLSNLEKSIKLHDKLDREKVKLEQSIESAREHLESELGRQAKEIKQEEEEIEIQKKSIVDLESLESDEIRLKKVLEDLPTFRKESTYIRSIV